MANDYGKTYPGSGGARHRPPNGGAPHHAMPSGMIEYGEPTRFRSQQVTTEVPNNWFERLLGAPATSSRTTTEMVPDRFKVVKKNYR